MTLRSRMLLLVAGLCAAALVVMGVTAAAALRAYLMDRADSTLRSAVPAVRAATVLSSLAYARGQEPQRTTALSEFVIELQSSDGAAVRTIGGSQVPARPLINQADLAVSEPQTVAGYRVVVVRDGNVTGLVGLPMAPIDETVRQLTVIASITAATVLVLLTAIAWLLLHRQLRPLHEIATAATALADGDLGRRVPDRLPGPRTEVGRLTAAVNGMLSRIQAALAARERSERRMREFVADASHELRTPVTSIRGYLQLVRTGVVDLRERPDVLNRLEDEARRMSTLVTSLLYLARLDAGPPSRRAPVDLAVLIHEAAADARAVTPERPLTVTAPDSCFVTADPDGVRQVLANLLDNVRAHTPPATPAEIVLATSATAARVAVTDAGPGFDQADAGRAFERFWRADVSRPASGGAGLGLSIVAEVVHSHGGETGIDGSTVWFTLPVES